MDFLADPVILARIQFAFTAMYHFLLVPVSIGLGLISWLSMKLVLTDPERKRMLRRLDFGSRSSPQHSH